MGNKVNVTKWATTRLPSSKLVVYLNVQKSRADANVVGAYVWERKEFNIIHDQESNGWNHYKPLIYKHNKPACIWVLLSPHFL